MCSAVLCGIERVSNVLIHFRYIDHLRFNLLTARGTGHRHVSKCIGHLPSFGVVYGVRVVTNTVQRLPKRMTSAMRNLKSGCAQLGLRCQVSASTASVVIQDQRFDVRVTERVSESLARGLAQTATVDELLVAQRITEDARSILRERNVSFFDERGYLSIRRPLLVVEAAVEIDAAPSTKRRRQPLDGIGLDVALWLLHTPEPGGVRAISREIGRTASSVSDALRRLVDEGLVTTDHQPLLPELFDAAVHAWRYRSIHMAVSGDPTTPKNAKALRTRLDDVSDTGWAWAGAAAEHAWRVPGISRKGGRPVLMVPDADSLDLAASILKVDARGAFDLVVAPVAWLASHRVERDGKVIVPAIAVALDLALDASRGREILNGWDPVGAHRVW